MADHPDYQPVRLEDYRPPGYRVDHVTLDVELDAQRTRVTTRLVVSHNEQKSFELDGKGLELHWIEIDGRRLAPSAYRYRDDILHLSTAPESFELRLCSSVNPRANPQEMGLFERRGILASECEPYGFRRISFFPDRPDILTTYTVRLIGDPERYPVMLSNGNPDGSGVLQDGRHWVRWQDPIPKPSYIFALFAGPLSRISDRYRTASGRDIQLNIYIEEAFAAYCDHAMASLKRALDWDERTYGFEYDLDVYTIVALVGHGNAMENKGLNLFAAEGIVADKDLTTDRDFLLIERIIAHEVFHNWTGNRVTCRDWFQLSLKEGLTRFRDQTYDQDLAMGTVKRIWQVQALRRNQFPDDDGPNAHAVRPRSYYTVENFYNATVYDKGAEIVRMLYGLLGPEVFHTGMRLFIERHDLQAVTVEDFLAVMAEAGGRDLEPFAQWYDIVGRPRLDVEHHYSPERQELELRFTQRFTEGIPGPVVIPVATGLTAADGNALGFRLADCPSDKVTDAVLEISEASQTVVLHDVESEPIPSLLRGFSAPISLHCAFTRQQFRVLASRDADPFVRWDSMQRLYIDVIREVAGQHAAGEALHCDTVVTDCLDAVLANADRDPGLTAELLDVADEPNLSLGLDRIDLDSLLAGRGKLLETLASQLHGTLLDIYDRHASNKAWSLDEPSIGSRMLKNACLRLLAVTGSAHIVALCLRQLREANCMTDRLAPLVCLADLECPERDEALDWAYAHWKSNPLLMNYWFTVQAMGRTSDVIPRLKSLLEHPAYDPRNTAHAMALFGTFFRQNRVAFHDPCGEGYAWLGDVLLQVDKIRPGGTAWLMPQIRQWRRYDDHRRRLMRETLERVAATEGISRALYENVSGTLGES